MGRRWLPGRRRTAADSPVAPPPGPAATVAELRRQAEVAPDPAALLGAAVRSRRWHADRATMGLVDRASGVTAAREAVQLSWLLIEREAGDLDTLVVDLIESVSSLVRTDRSEQGRSEARQAVLDLVRRVDLDLEAGRAPPSAQYVLRPLFLLSLDPGPWALEAAETAVRICRRLLEINPGDADLYRPDLGFQLRRLSDLLAGTTDRTDEALRCAQEAVQLSRHPALPRRPRSPDEIPRLAGPDSMRASDLPRSLDVLGRRLAEAGRAREALTATREALSLHRSLASWAPDTFPDHRRVAAVRASTDLVRRLVATGARDEALHAAHDAVTGNRHLVAVAGDQAPTYLPALAEALAVEAVLLMDRDPDAAARRLREAVRCWRRHAGTDADDVRSALARGLTGALATARPTDPAALARLLAGGGRSGAGLGRDELRSLLNCAGLSGPAPGSSPAGPDGGGQTR